MIVKVENNVFENTDAFFQKMDNFLHIINDRHFWLIDNYSNIETIKNSDWYQGLRSTYKNIIDNYIIASATKKKQNVLIISSEQENFNIDEANFYLNQAFILILENSTNDGHFINSLIKNFPKSGDLISKHKSNKWLEYGNGNGCTGIINFINEKLGYYINQPKEDKFKYIRCFVLVDSDSEYPNMQCSEAKQKLLDYLNENQLPFHFLEKREIENYLPDEVIETIEGNEDYISAYLKLNSIQKDYFDLEKGFPDKNFDTFKTEIKELYKNIEASNITVFRKQKFKIEGGFKSEFPKLFSHTKVTQDTLKNRVSHQVNNPNELEAILDKISKLL
jgi:hypothetical protein